MPYRKKDRLSTGKRAQPSEADCFRLGTGRTKRDIDKAWTLIDCAGGDSHLCSVHFPDVANTTRDGVLEVGDASAVHYCTDICDGIAQGSDAMNYSFASRDVIAMASEFHVQSATSILLDLHTRHCAPTHLEGYLQ